MHINCTFRSMKTSVLIIACLCWASLSVAVERRVIQVRKLRRGDYNVFHGDKKVHYGTAILSDTGNKEKIRARIVEKKVPVPYTVEKRTPFIVEKKVPVRVKIPVPKPYIVEKKVPYPVKEYVKVPYYVPKPYNVIKKIPYNVEVPVPRPFEVQVPVPKPYNVEKKVPVPVKVYVPQPYTVEKKVPYPVKVMVPVPQPYTVERKVPYEVKVPVDRPYVVHVPKPYPVYYEEHVPVPVEKHVPYEVKVPVDRPYPVEVRKRVPYNVKIPVPIPVGIHKKVPVHIETNVPIPVRVPVNKPYPIVNEVPEFIEKEVAHPIYTEYSEEEWKSSGQPHASRLTGKPDNHQGTDDEKQQDKGSTFLNDDSGKLELLSDEVWHGHKSHTGFEYPIEKPLGEHKDIEGYKSAAGGFNWGSLPLGHHGGHQAAVKFTNTNALAQTAVHQNAGGNDNDDNAWAQIGGNHHLSESDHKDINAWAHEGGDKHKDIKAWAHEGGDKDINAWAHTSDHAGGENPKDINAWAHEGEDIHNASEDDDHKDSNGNAWASEDDDHAKNNAWASADGDEWASSSPYNLGNHKEYDNTAWAQLSASQNAAHKDIWISDAHATTNAAGHHQHQESHENVNDLTQNHHEWKHHHQAHDLTQNHHKGLKWQQAQTHENAIDLTQNHHKGHEWEQPEPHENPHDLTQNHHENIVTKDLANNGWRSVGHQTANHDDYVVINKDAEKTWVHPVEIHLENYQGKQQAPKSEEIIVGTKKQEHKHETLPQPEKLTQSHPNNLQYETLPQPEKLTQSHPNNLQYKTLPQPDKLTQSNPNNLQYETLRQPEKLTQSHPNNLQYKTIPQPDKLTQSNPNNLQYETLRQPNKLTQSPNNLQYETLHQPDKLTQSHPNNLQYETLRQPEILTKSHPNLQSRNPKGRPQSSDVIYGRDMSVVQSSYRVADPGSFKPVQEYPIYVANYGKQSVRARDKIADPSKEQSTPQPSKEPPAATTTAKSPDGKAPGAGASRSARMNEPEVWEHPSAQDWSQPDTNGWVPVESSNERMGHYYDERS